MPESFEGLELADEKTQVDLAREQVLEQLLWILAEVKDRRLRTSFNSDRIILWDPGTMDAQFQAVVFRGDIKASVPSRNGLGAPTLHTVER